MEDIKVLEEYLNYEATKRKLSGLEIQAIENLIARNKKLEEEYQKRIIVALNKEVVIVNGKMYTIDKELYNDLLNDTVNNYIPKSKVKEIIQKYYNNYEKEKEYRYTGDVEEEQYILIEIEKELLQEGEK